MLLFPLQYCIFYIVDVILMLTGPYYSHLGSLKKKTKTQVKKGLVCLQGLEVMFKSMLNNQELLPVKKGQLVLV